MKCYKLLISKQLLANETKSLEHLQAFEDAGVPVILFNRVKNRPGFPKVLVDDYHGAFIGVEHLIKNGYRKIGHIGGPENLQISKNRFRGYCDALNKYGLEYNPDWTIYHDLSPDGAQQCARTLLAKQIVPDAVNDPKYHISATTVLKTTLIEHSSSKR